MNGPFLKGNGCRASDGLIGDRVPRLLASRLIHLAAPARRSQCQKSIH